MKTIQVKRDLYVNALEEIAPKSKIDLLAWLYLYDMYGTDIFYLLNLMAGLTIKIPTYRTLAEIFKKVKAKKDYPEYLYLDIEEPIEDD